LRLFVNTLFAPRATAETLTAQNCPFAQSVI
jgi:hypothetical protein